MIIGFSGLAEIPNNEQHGPHYLTCFAVHYIDRAVFQAGPKPPPTPPVPIAADWQKMVKTVSSSGYLCDGKNWDPVTNGSLPALIKGSIPNEVPQISKFEILWDSDLKGIFGFDVEYWNGYSNKVFKKLAPKHEYKIWKDSI